jgi:hypothetical protein
MAVGPPSSTFSRCVALAQNRALPEQKGGAT